MHGTTPSSTVVKRSELGLRISHPFPKVSGQNGTGIVYSDSPLQKLPGIASAASTTPPKPRTTGKKRHRQSMITSLCLKSYKSFTIRPAQSQLLCAVRFHLLDRAFSRMRDHNANMMYRDVPSCTMMYLKPQKLTQELTWELDSDGPKYWKMNQSQSSTYDHSIIQPTCDAKGSDFLECIPACPPCSPGKAFSGKLR